MSVVSVVLVCYVVHVVCVVYVDAMTGGGLGGVGWSWIGLGCVVLCRVVLFCVALVWFGCGAVELLKNFSI